MLQLEFFKNNNLIKICSNYTKKEIDECFKKENFINEVYKQTIEELIFNNNVELEYYKYIYTKFNIKFSQYDISNRIIANTFTNINSNNFIEKVKYVVKKILKI